MQGWRWKKKTEPGDAGWRVRKAERFGGATVRCALGEVEDLSASGMRVLCQGKPPVKPGGVVPIRLRFGDGSLQLQAQVRWSKRKGLKTHEIGLSFVNLKPGMAKVLEAVARFGMASAAKQMDDSGVAGHGPGAKQPAGKTKNEQAKQAGATMLEAELPNYYQILGLKPDATDGQIKAAYRRLAVALHPDHNSEPDAMQRFEAINEAYHVLSDRLRRESYQRMAS